MKRLIAQNPQNAERILPYIGGQEVNNHPRQEHHRYVINLDDLEEEQARYSWPDLLEIVEDKVRREREKLKDNTDGRKYKKFWWRFARNGRNLYRTIAGKNNVLATNCGASPHLAFAFLPTGMIYAHTLTVISLSTFSAFCTLQSRVHERWARLFSSTLEDRLRYTPSDCFRNFPFPERFESDPALESAGEAYHSHRAALMVERGEGLTKTYNRFHDRAEHAEDIQKLRDLHTEMDREVLRAYGWDDLAERAEPTFLDESDEPEFAYQGRLFWPSDFRDEVLAKLLELNAERHAEEVRLGLVTPEGRLIHGAEEYDESDIDDSEDGHES